MPGDGEPGDVDGVVPACDLTAPFGPVVPVPGLADPTYVEATIRLTSDELTGYLWTTRVGNIDLDVARRASPGSPFSLTAIGELNTPAAEFEPAISADELTLVFRSSRTGGTGSADLYVARRSSRTSSFTLVGEVPNVNTPSDEIQPFLTASALYFTSARAGDFDLYRSAFTGTTFGLPTMVEVSTVGVDESDAALSADELALYFTSGAAGELGVGDIWVATRASTSDSFGSAMPLPALSSPAYEGASWLSVDSCRIYISSTRAGTPDIYVATRP